MELPTPATVKKIATANSAGPSDGVNYALLPTRLAGQPDWLTLAVARKNEAAIAGLIQTPPPKTAGNLNLAMTTATKNADIATVQKLIDAKIALQPDSKNRSPLAIAVSMNSEELTSALLKGQSNTDKTLVTLATEKCLPNLVSKFVAAGSSFDTKFGLVRIAQNCNNWQDFRDQLVGADFNAKDSLGRTAAWFAAAKGDTSLLSWLSKSGADLSLSDQAGFSPLHVAAVNKQDFSLRYILSILPKADVVTSRGTTPLMLAAYVGCSDCISTLLEKSSELDLKNNDGDSSLMFAVRGLQASAAALLVKSGANLDSRNGAGDTPTKLAERLAFPLLKGPSE
jgi:ankyrin repeat protein